MSKWSGFCVDLKVVEKLLNNTAGRRMSAKAHSINGATASGQWKLPKLKNIGNCSRKTLGFKVQIARDINQQDVEIGCAALLNRINKMRDALIEQELACLISGGEFSCPVRGRGTGGRNAESVLRTALLLDEKSSPNFCSTAFL